MSIEISSDVAAVLDCLPNPALLLSTDYRILLANQRYHEVYGDGRPLRHRRCYEVLHGNTVPCDLAGETCPLKASLDSGEPQRVMHVHHTPRGQEYVSVETLPVRGERGQVKYLVEVLKPDHIANTQPQTQGLVGRSPTFQQTLDRVTRVAPSETTVLLLGPSGTGKELFAKTIHQRSRRHDKTFVPVECIGLPEALFESELFGHVKGAFTGAHHCRQGLIAAAEGGTLFLDEIGDVPLSMQVKLLRLLETRSYRSVGSSDPERADFRLICATNKDLATMVREGQFREDLYYRINVFEIELPPLRERIDDLTLLIDSMLKSLAADRTIHVAPETLTCLRGYAFPGNIRELRNIIERALLLCDGEVLLPAHLPAHCCDPTHNAGDQTAIIPLVEAEKQYLRQVLSHYQGERRDLAKQLGLSERVLYRKLAELKQDR